MKRFVWPLQRVLEVKEKAEQAKRTELLKLTEELAATRTELLAQQGILKALIDDVAVKESQKRLAEQEFFIKYSKTIDALIKKLQSDAEILETQQKEKITELLKIRRFRKALEKLRSKAKRRFIKEQEKIEQKEQDERTTIGFARRMMANQAMKLTHSS